MTAPFAVVTPGSAAPGATAPATPRNLPHTGGEANPSAEALRGKFGAAIERVDVVWGETTAHVQGARLLDIVRWLHDDPSQQYDYLSDVTAVEHRDLDQPLEIVWHLRSLPFRRFLRLKVRITQGDKLEVDSVWPVYKGADWLEREAYDMFGVNFRGHPDMRRILMWESFKEGYPLRKDFPLRGRFSRSEQLRQALDQDTESRYSMEELSVADAFEDLPPDMRERLASGEKVGE